MSINNAILKIFFAHRRQLIPIANGGLSPYKRPLHKQWTTQEYDPETIKDYARRGYNLGWRLTPTDVVIDIDVKNDGLTGLAILLEDFQRHDPSIEDLGDVFPTVKTGGGGYHYYASVPLGIKLRNSIQRYGKGVEFKSVGQQVIIPGSRHPSGNVYTFDDFSDATGPAVPLPEWLVRMVQRLATPTVPSAHNGEATLTPDQLTALLNQLDAADYSTNEDWFPLMAAAHEATGGAGVDAFVNWSLSDDSFVGHDGIIRHRWSSFRPGQVGNIGVGTLYKEVTQQGGTLPPVTLAAPAVSAIQDLPPAAPFMPPLSDTPIIRYSSPAELESLVTSLNPMSSSEDIRAVLSDVAKLDQLDQSVYLQRIKLVTGRPIGALRNTLNAMRTADSADVDDVTLEINTYLLNKWYDGGHTLLHGADQRFWEYTGKYWNVVEDNIIENLLLKASFQYRKNNPHITLPLPTLITSGVKLLRARQATRRNLHTASGARQPVVNTNNCEVWLDLDTGTVQPKVHTPDSYLTTCLDTTFNPHAKCPAFSLALQQMFAACPDRDDVIRHLWEVIGYIIQPKKNIATWVLFHGGGANGKTVVLNVINRLLGKACLNKSVDELDTRRNGHALADLPGKLCVIDEDMDAKSILPDSTLKKVSESKMLTANPKSRATFEFWNQAIILFASNEYPRVKDLSHGMRRRALVFDFNRTFLEHEQNPELTKQVTDTEMDGVLIEALKGHARLRQRGRWDVPQSCTLAKNKWMIASNTVHLFCDEMIRPSAHSDQVVFSLIYGSYRLWCAENGYTKQSTKPNFRAALEALNMPVSHGTGNQYVVRGIKLMTNTIDMENLK